jgi:hypothetical protein
LPLIIQNYLWDLFYMDNNNTDQLEVQNSNNEEPSTSFVVSTLEDENDGDFSDGDLSLREAIALANQAEGTDTITFNSGLSGNVVLSLGELVINDSLTINGLGADNLTIDGNASSRIFKIDDGNAETDIDVAIDEVSITNGRAIEETTDSIGGGILNQENLTLTNSRVTGNIAETNNDANTSRGGGIYTSGTLNLIDSSISDNNGIFGGGIFSLAANVNITNSRIENNYGRFVGGGLYHQDSEINLTNSIVTGNEASFAFGGVALNNSTGNISYSTISNNVAQNSSSGGIDLSDSTGNISHSTITGNMALRESGGGINVNSSTANIENSTINNNSANSYGGGIASGLSSKTNISNSTITGNNSLQGGSGIYQRPELVIEYDQSILSGNVSLSSTIVAGNANNKDLGGDGFDSQGNNLIGNGDSANSTFISSKNDLVGTADSLIDPKLGELQDNGGSTQTNALLEGSPAIDAGSNPNNLETDQRGEGFDRTVGNGTDIGAYEVQDGGGGEIPDELIVSTLKDENDSDYSSGDLSLREAIVLANEPGGLDTITFDSKLNSGTITLNESLERDLTINDSVSIVGLGQENLTLDGGFIFNVDADTDFALDGLNLTGSKINSSGNLTLSDSTISQTVEIGSADNSAIISRGNATILDSTIKDNRGGGNVGILFESGTATIERSAITGNDSSDYAQSGVIIRSDATVDIINSTIANNKARANGGIENAGTVNITNSTLANNTGGLSAGGINNLNDGVVTLTSSLLTNNTGSASIGDVSGNGEFISGGNNLISNGDDAVGFVDGVNGDRVGSNGDDPFNPQTELLIDPNLGELQNNGGSTETFALLEGSPAIDAGSNPNNLETDQRGERFNRTVGNGTDIGAYEVQTIINNADIVGTDNRDILQGTPSGDRIFGLEGDDFIQGLDGNDSIDGGKGSDRILSGSGINTIIDGAGDDILLGGADDDIFLAANAGNDLYSGDTGKDIYVYDLNDNGLFDRDRIIDFEQREDQIAFRTLVNDPQSLDNFADLDTDNSGVLDELDARIQISNSSTVIDFSDIFGRPQGSDTITLIGVTNLDSDNFLFDEATIGTEFG